MTEFIETPAPSGPNPYRIDRVEHRASRFLIWEVNSAYCRKDVEIDNSEGTTPILPGTVIVDGDSAFVGILYGEPVVPGAVETRTVVYRGAAIVTAEFLIFPTVADVEPDAATGTEPVDGETATALLKIDLEAAIAAAGIDIQ